MNYCRKEVYIFDIDGCIMPNIFNEINFFLYFLKKANKLNKRATQIQIYPSFVKYYKKHCKKAELVVFLTGRKFSEFGEITRKQLKKLENFKNFNLIFYPESKKHQLKEYLKWKTQNILDIINNKISIQNMNSERKMEYDFRIFDDISGYFRDLKKITKELPIKLSFSQIYGETCWS